MFARSHGPRRPAPARLALSANASDSLRTLASQAPDDPAGPISPATPQEQAEARGQQLANRLQARPIASGRPALDPDELTIVLEAVTNLPDETIAAIARRASGTDDSRPARSRAAVLAAAADLDHYPSLVPGGSSTNPASAAPAPKITGRSPARLAADSFPHTVADVVRASAAKGAWAVENTCDVHSQRREYCAQASPSPMTQPGPNGGTT